jgi:hypothetical protein
MHLVPRPIFHIDFCIPTMFDMIPLELVRFRNSRYFISSCSCPALLLSLSFSYSNVEVKTVEGFCARFHTNFAKSEHGHHIECLIFQYKF